MTAKQILEQARRHGVCSKLKGTETTAELMNLIFTPQGVEFCLKHQFPSLDVFRAYKGCQAIDNGIYIDTDLNGHNMDRVLLVGDSNATLTYDDASKPHYVTLMHGAKAHIVASGYAVVFVSGKGATCEVKNYAKIL